jgi:gluconate:H+ symporter, GntP family
MFGPLTCLFVGIGLIIFLMLVLRFHAFLALISAAIVIAFLSDQIPVDKALPMVAERFGAMMGGIGILLAMAAIIGKCLMDSGAAERIVRAFTRIFGKGNEHYSLLSSGFVLSIPVFFDTVFYLLAPLARAMYARRKECYVLIVCAAAAGGVITHALVPPTPGPIMVAEIFDDITKQMDNPIRISILLTMFVGLLSSIVPLIIGGILYPIWINRRLNIIPKDTLGVSQNELEEIADKPDSELPNLYISLLPFVLPVILLAGASILKAYIPTETDPAKLAEIISASSIFTTISAMIGQENFIYCLGVMKPITNIIGDKNLVFFLGALIAIWLLVSQKSLSMKDSLKQLEPAIASGAVIAFITCAGGAFGKILYEAKVGDAIAQAAEHWDLSLIVLAFLTASLIRIAQGSATVAMITTAGIIAPTLTTINLPYHPVYLVAVIGFGATGYSWMNDSGFWIFSQLTGLTETQTLKTWTAMLTVIALTGFVWVLLLSRILPLI